MPKINISIVIPTYNHCDEFLKPCVDSILKHTDMEGIEVIVSANGCKDNTKEYVESLNHPAVKLLWNEEPLGYTKATNEGIKIAKGDYILLLNNDTVILDQEKNTWIKMHLDPFSDPKVGMTGPMKAYCPFAKRDFMIFFCAMIKREMFDKIGLLDETFNPGFGEDTDFGIKLQDLGYEIIQIPHTQHTFSRPNFMVGGCPIYHKGEGTFANWPGGEKLLAERRFMLMNRYAKDIKLNLGCGERMMQGYFNIDIKGPKCDLAWDVRTIPLDDNKVSEIVAIHLLEHFKVQEVDTILREWMRVLKPEGKLVLEMPNVQALFKDFETKDTAGRRHILNCVFGAHTPEFPHLYGWYPDTIWEQLSKLGFHNIVQKEPQVDHWGINMRIECTKGANLPEGFFGDSDIATYRDHLSKVPVGGKIAELGCWKGRSLCSVADIIKDRKLQVVAVDTFEGSASEGDGQASPAEAKKENVREVFEKNMARYGLNPTIMKMSTHEASQLVKDYEFDFVFIDADHTYDAVRRDIQDWWPKVKRGGLLAGHDCQWKSVADALTAEFGHLVLTNWANMWWHNKGKVIDCFPFCNELDQLEIRLRELENDVDYFVLVEGTETHSGKPKPLHFKENRERFRKWMGKIIHVIVDKWPEYVQGSSDSPWARERTQRMAIAKGMKLIDISPFDVLILGDADEIISSKTLKNYRRHMGLCSLEMNLYYYFANYQSITEKWYESKIVPYSVYLENKLDPCATRYVLSHMVNGVPSFTTTTLKKIPNAGWHFSYQGGVDEVIKKIQSFAHQEFNRPEILERSRVERLIDEGKDVFGRSNAIYKAIPIDDTFPQCLKDPKFSHMIRTEKKVEEKPVSGKKKILVLVSNYAGQKTMCKKMVAGLKKIQGHDLDIKVFSSVPCGFSNCEEILIEDKKGWDFALGIYDYLKKQNLSSWDYVLMTENDILYKEENFDTVFKYEDKPFAIGFMRYEEKDGEKYFTDAQFYEDQTTFEQRFGIVETIEDGSFIRFENCHQGSWFLKTDVVKHLLKAVTLGTCLEGKMSNFYFSEKWPGTSAGIKKFVPVEDIQKLMVHHMPNKYINFYKPSIKVETFLAESKKLEEVLS